MSKKRDARIARALTAKIQKEEKSARLVERVKSEIPRAKTVRLGADPASIYQMNMDWSATGADLHGEWSWGPRAWTPAAWSEVILPKLANFRTMRWGEIEAAVSAAGHHMHHPMTIEVICDECQTRLIELDKVDGDIYRFRLGSSRRLWGFRIAHVFEILWYDPEHNVYPVDPD